GGRGTVYDHLLGFRGRGERHLGGRRDREIAGSARLHDSAHTGGELVCRALSRLGTDVLFSVSGNQILPIYDAAGEAGLRIIHTRHESAAAYAATGWAALTGKTGAALTSAGPGFLAALQGVAACRSMELPMLFLSGDSAASQRGRGAFQ